MSVLTRCDTHHLLEHAGKVLGVLETETVGHLVDRERWVKDVLLRQVDDPVLYISLGGDARLALDEVAEVTGRKASFVGKITDGRQSVSFRMTIVKIFPQMLLEACEDVTALLYTSTLSTRIKFSFAIIV